MVVACAPRIFGNVHPADPQLVPVEITERIRQRRLARTDRLDLRAHEHHTRHELLQDLVVERGAFVPYVYIFLFRHKYPNRYGSCSVPSQRDGNRFKITNFFIFDLFYTSFCLFSVCTRYAQRCVYAPRPAPLFSQRINRCNLCAMVTLARLSAASRCMISRSVSSGSSSSAARRACNSRMYPSITFDL